MPLVTLRDADESDISWLAKLNDWDAARTARKVASGEFFIAEREGEPVGFTRLGFLWSEHAFIELILVPDHANRGHGIGRSMLGFLESRFAESPYLYSSCVSHEEAPQTWHRRNGFEDCEYLYQVNWGTEGEIFFRKRLGNA